MLESFVAWVLNNYVGEYFRLNTDQLSIALLQGQVDLENVPLRATALSKFDIPVQVKCGVIGALQLRIPLAHIRSQPWTLRLRDCLALLGPASAASQCHDVQTVDKWQQQRRERWLDELETGHKRKLLEQLGIEATEDTAEQDSWWGASLLSSISNNIQVILENAHIRYECPSYNFGVKIQSLTIQTTNSNWRPGFVQSAEGINIFKKFDITGFSIYWNPTDEDRQQQQRNSVCLVPSYEMLREELCPSATHCFSDRFILLPFSLEVRIEQNSSRFPLLRTVPSTPRFKLDIRSQRIELELNKRQIAQIHSLAQDWSQFERARPHRKWRPVVSLHHSPKQWWRFAIGRTLDEARAQRPFFSRSAVVARVRLVNAYARAYHRRLTMFLEVHSDNDDEAKNAHHLSFPSPPMSHEDIALIKQIEHGSEFAYNVLHCLREAVFQQLLLKFAVSKTLHSFDESPFELIRPESRVMTEQTTKGSAPTTGWYGWITHWFTEGNDEDEPNECENSGKEANEAIYLSMKPPKLTKHKLDPELAAVESRMEAEILQMLNESWDELTVLRRDNLLAEIVLNIAKVFFRLSEESQHTGVKPSSSSITNSSGGCEASFSLAAATDDVQLLTFDLSQLCSRIHLSPKEHRTEVSLSVADFAVQRVQHQQKTTTAEHSESSADNKKKVAETSNTTDELNCFGSDEFDNESLIYGFQQKNNAQSTHLLLAIGRTYDENETAEVANGRSQKRNFQQKCKRKAAVHCSSSFAATGSGDRREGKGENAILRLFYKRLAPKLEVYHELNISCTPLTIICDECALCGLFEPFTQKMPKHFDEKQRYEQHLEFASPTTDTVTHQMFLSVSVPELVVELRSQKASHSYLLNPKTSQVVPSTSSNLNQSDAHFMRSIASSFARANIHSLLLNFSRRDCHRLSKLELHFDAVLLEDIFQGCPEGFPLLNFINDDDDEMEDFAQLQNPLKNSSHSCPDLTVCRDSVTDINVGGVHADKMATKEVTKSLEQQCPPLNVTAAIVVDQLLGSSMPPMMVIGNNEKSVHGHSESLRMPSPEGQTRRKMTMTPSSFNSKSATPNRRHSLCFVFVDGTTCVEQSKPQFNCQISGHFKGADIELGLNRRTWILLLDFFGLLTSSHNYAGELLENNLNKNYRINCELSARSVKLAMNYAEIEQRLGYCVLDGPKLTVQMDVNVVDEPIQIWLTADALSVTDSMPFCNSLYPERLIIQNTNDGLIQSPIRVNVLKYRTKDPQCSLHEFDLSLSVEVTGSFNYLHTHRFFYALMDFWLHLAELYDKVLFSNYCRTMTEINGSDCEHSNSLLVNCLKTRCKLSVDIAGGDINLFVPLSQCSPKAIVAECCAIRARNSFCYSSSLRDLITKHLINNQCQPTNLSPSDAADCLLDATGITLRNLRIWHGTFVTKTRSELNWHKDKKKRMERHGFIKCFDAFDGKALFSKANQQIMMDKLDFSLTVDIYRNLSASNIVPNLFVLLRLQDVSLCFTTEFYKLLRGCLNHNFGELLIPQPEAIPIELLEVPEEVGLGGERHSMFTLRFILKKVQLHLHTPLSSIRPDVFEKFAILYIRSAKLYYDSFVDDKSEFDFICGSATLEDARAGQTGDNVFRKIVQPSSNSRQPRTSHGDSSGSSKNGSHSDGGKKKHLLFETHIKMRRDEPPVISVILARARVILLMDWIETLKAFILLNFDFVPPVDGGHKSVHSNFEMPKSGVLTRSVGSPQFVFPRKKHKVFLPPISSSDSNDSNHRQKQQQMTDSKFVLKVTLRECDLVALEDSRRRDTFALIAHTTAAIIANTLPDNSQIGSQYEIKQFCLYWCVMDSQTDTWTQLTNDTTATATVAFGRPPSDDASTAAAAAYERQQHSQSVASSFQSKSLEHLLGNSNDQQQLISVELGTLVIRGLLKDFFIVKCVLDKFIEVWNRFRDDDIQFWNKIDEQSTITNSHQHHHLLFPKESSSRHKCDFGNAKNAKTTTKLLVKSDNLCIWILEEGNKINTTPFLRLNIRELNINKTFSRVQIGFNLSIDYYRLRTLPGWEPLLEHCHKFTADINFTEPHQLNVRLKPAAAGTIELTLTQPFIERTLDFIAYWNSIRKIVFDSEQTEGLNQFRHSFFQQRKNASDGKGLNAKGSEMPSTSSHELKNEDQQRPTPSLTQIVNKAHLMLSTDDNHRRPYDTKTLVVNSGLLSAVDVQLELDEGLGISLVGSVDDDGEIDAQKQEELCYGRLSGIKLNIEKSKATYRVNCHVNSIQIDNQIVGADRWHFLFCDPSALKDEPEARLPALAFEMSYTPTEFFDVYECFRLKLSNACILLDEQLLWHLVHFVRCFLRRSCYQNDQQQPQTSDTTAAEEGGHGAMASSSSSLLDKNCYFGTLQLEVGNISLSVLTVDKSALSPSIRQLKESFIDQIILFSFENALVTLTPFCWLRCFCPVGRLLDTLGNFYLDELKRQKLNIIFAMDAFGNPMAFGNELKEGFQGLIFEGDLAGFAFGLGYGAANSISKVTSSMAQGVGSLTFDEKHEELRRRMRRAKPEQSGPLTHLYGGIKGLGVGVFGGLTAIVKNTVVATQEDGLISGIARGVTTGAFDTVTKPLQGTLDLLEGTASAVKEIVGAPLVRRAHFPDTRLRTPRACSSLSGLLPCYSVETAEAQQELLRITGTYALNDENRLLTVVPFLVRTNLDGACVVQRALISLVQCCIVRQVDSQPSMVTYRILFQHLNTVQLVSEEKQQHQNHNLNNGTASASAHQQQRLTLVEFVYNSDGRRHTQPSSSSSVPSFSLSQQQQHYYQQRLHQQTLTLWCSDRETAKHFCKQIMRAKALFDRRTTGGKVLQRNAKKLLPIFTI